MTPILERPVGGMKQDRPINQTIKFLAGGVGSGASETGQDLGESDARVRECEGCSHFDDLNEFCWIDWRRSVKGDPCKFGFKEVS